MAVIDVVATSKRVTLAEICQFWGAPRWSAGARPSTLDAGGA